MNRQDYDTEPEIHLLGTGTWFDWLPNSSRPVVALGEKDIYSVWMHGHSFSLPIDGSKNAAIGFYTTRFVAAENLREAEKAAHNRVMQLWKNKGYLKLCGQLPDLSTEEVNILDEHLRLGSGAGSALYSNDDSDE